MFAPHPDDETFGCGGTIIRKLALGAGIDVCVLTDGGASNLNVIPHAEMARIRTAEVRTATEALGVSPDRLTLCGFPDGALADHARDAQEQVLALLMARRPAEVYVPFRLDQHADHAAANRIVRAALEQYDARVTVYEYPIWYLYHWPAVIAPGDTIPRGAALVGVAKTALHAFADLNVSVYVGGTVLEKKKRAIAAHASQLAGYSDDPRWFALADIAGGEFVARLAENWERYRRWKSAGTS